jgi:hypothetical protein
MLPFFRLLESRVVTLPLILAVAFAHRAQLGIKLGMELGIKLRIIKFFARNFLRTDRQTESCFLR